MTDWLPFVKVRDLEISFHNHVAQCKRSMKIGWMKKQTLGMRSQARSSCWGSSVSFFMLPAQNIREIDIKLMHTWLWEHLSTNCAKCYERKEQTLRDRITTTTIKEQGKLVCLKMIQQALCNKHILTCFWHLYKTRRNLILSYLPGFCFLTYCDNAI